MDDQTHSFILDRLAGETSDDGIIFEVCQQTGLKWEAARALVDEVKGDHDSEIEIRQFPIKGLLSFVFVVLGVILILEPVIHLWTILGITDTLIQAVSGRGSVSTETVLALLRSRCALLSWIELPSILFTILVGVAIIVANIKFMGETWKNLVYSWQKN